MTPSGQVLLIDDDGDLLDATLRSLDLARLRARGFTGAEPVLDLVTAGFDGIVIADLRVPAMDRFGLMTHLHEIDAQLPVILIAGHCDVPLAVQALREGAYDFVEKPFCGAQLVGIAARALEYRALVLENRRLRAVAGQSDDLEARLVGRSPAMIDLRRLVRSIGPSDADLLIEGDTGTGKEVVAQSLHDLSPRRGKPFVAISCSALPEAMMAAELFGHGPGGGVPGAARDRMGRFHHARGGTLVLDDIGALPLPVQARLVRMIAARGAAPPPEQPPPPPEARIIATTRRPLAPAVAGGRFRADLLERLGAVGLRLPPLAERAEDIPALFARLLAQAQARHRLPERPAPPALLAEMARRDWPGNVRELRNAAERCALGLSDTADPRPARRAGATLAEQVAQAERKLLVDALIRHRGSLRPIYESLGLSRKTLYDKLRRHGIDRTKLLSGS